MASYKRLSDSAARYSTSCFSLPNEDDSGLFEAGLSSAHSQAAFWHILVLIPLHQAWFFSLP